MYWVGQRRRQIGMRRALGARRIDILRYFHTENLLIAGIGALLGVAGGLGTNLWMATHLGTAAHELGLHRHRRAHCSGLEPAGGAVARLSGRHPPPRRLRRGACSTRLNTYDQLLPPSGHSLSAGKYRADAVDHCCGGRGHRRHHDGLHACCWPCPVIRFQQNRRSCLRHRSMRGGRRREKAITQVKVVCRTC